MKQIIETQLDKLDLSERIINGNPDWAIGKDFYKLNDCADKIAIRDGMNQGFVVPLKVFCFDGSQKVYKYVAMIRGINCWDNISSASRDILADSKDIGRVLYEIGSAERRFSHFEKVINLSDKKNISADLAYVYMSGRSILREYELDESLLEKVMFTVLGVDPHNLHLKSASIRIAEETALGRFNPLKPSYSDDVRSVLNWECIYDIKRHLVVNDKVGAFYLDVTQNADY